MHKTPKSAIVDYQPEFRREGVTQDDELQYLKSLEISQTQNNS
ncbi:hypothetical protein [Fortiea sp. LEGE XX443]|nr:hypothetical protein [Fortiea sp. LEGE XX443]